MFVFHLFANIFSYDIFENNKKTMKLENLLVALKLLLLGANFECHISSFIGYHAALTQHMWAM